MTPTRRAILRGLLASAAVAAPGAGLLARAAADCDGSTTPRQTPGPFFTPGAPARSDLREPGLPGTPLLIRGEVVSTDCRPVPGVRLDFWQCDAAGRYDNDGFRLRGHQLADAAGAYELTTVKPAAYGGLLFRRTPHIHVRLRVGGAEALTTQLYFPGEPTNDRDGLFDPRLLMRLDERGEGLVGSFRFVIG